MTSCVMRGTDHTVTWVSSCPLLCTQTDLGIYRPWGEGRQAGPVASS